jgi:predicted nucleic acid-binding protein
LAVLVSDTSIIIDLERGNFLEDLFRLPFEFAVPDLLFRKELEGPLGDQLIELGLRIEELVPAELTRAIAIRREQARLSTPDTFAFAIAERRAWTLLTGDGALRELAKSIGVPTHGVLWLCDRFAEHEVVSNDRLYIGLCDIFNHPRCRLPAAEVHARLNKYGPE